MEEHRIVTDNKENKRTREQENKASKPNGPKDDSELLDWLMMEPQDRRTLARVVNVIVR